MRSSRFSTLQVVCGLGIWRSFKWFQFDMPIHSHVEDGSAFSSSGSVLDHKEKFRGCIFKTYQRQCNLSRNWHLHGIMASSCDGARGVVTIETNHGAGISRRLHWRLQGSGSAATTRIGGRALDTLCRWKFKNPLVRAGVCSLSQPPVTELISPAIP